MLYSLFYGDNEALRFDLDESYIEVVDNQYLPYALKDCIKSTGEKDFKGSVQDVTYLRDYLASRTLNLSRENAKVILNVAALPQSLNTEQRLKIVLACNGLSMQDSFWIKEVGRDVCFDDMCLRHHKLSDVSYDIAILGHHVSATMNELIPDLTTEGMFPKYWHRSDNGEIELWKTDKGGGKLYSESEVKSSEILDALGYNHVQYRKEEKDGIIFSVCKCMANDEYSFVPMQEIMDWHERTGRVFPENIQSLYDSEFANMCIIDYVLANTDRHSGNWGVIVDSENNIVEFAPMFDLNQALVADVFGTDIGDLIYEPTGMTFKESAKKFAPYATVDFTKVPDLPDNVRERYNDVLKYRFDCLRRNKEKIDKSAIPDEFRDVVTADKIKMSVLKSDRTIIDG